jgi:hypothetical protein
MIKPIRIVFALALVSCIVSCKKDSEKKIDPNQTRLSKLVQYSSASPAKGIITTEFIYDDQQRIVEIATLSGDSVNNEIRSAKIRSLKFVYNGSDKNPSKTIGAMPYWTSPTAEIYHKYNSNGGLVQDSMYVSNNPPYYQRNLRNYLYTASKITVQTETRDYYGLQSISRDSFLVDNNNLIQAFYSSSYSGYMLKYDDKINPVTKLNIASLVTVSGLYGFPSFLAPGYCKNNITEYTNGYSNGLGGFTGQNVYYYTYFYNANNLPEECRFYSNNTNYIVKYYYIK